MDYGHDLLFGTFITPRADDPQRVVGLAELTEEVGLDLVTFQDHPYQPAFLDTSTLLAYVAARTERVLLAADVTNLPLRPPAVLARAAASLDLLTDGRFALGLGAGAFWDAIQAMGGTRLEPREAVAALTEAVDIIRALWDTAAIGGVRVAGTHYRVAGAKRGPAPAHAVPIWIGAYRARMLRLVGGKADGWLPSLSYLGGAERLDELNATIDAAARDAGREPAAVRRLVNVDASADAALLIDLALRHGMSGFIVTGDDPAVVRRLAADVAPRTRDAVSAARGRRSPA